jgi:DNA-binding response OmpR family regulator
MSTVNNHEVVVVLHWPEDADQRPVFAAAHMPRLFVVAPDEQPPAGLDALEDWMRAPVDPEEVLARTHHLAHAHEEDAVPPMLEDGDILRHRGRWVALSPAERAVICRLLARFDHCVQRGELDDVAGDAVLNTRIKRLRRRIAPLGLTIKTVRARGFVLCASGS